MSEELFGKDMLNQLQEMQSKMLRAQEELAQEMLHGTASGEGLVVTVTVSGDQRVTDVQIEPAELNGVQSAELRSVFLQAMNTALEASRELALERLGPLSAELGMQ